ncbi:hypothetical protein ACJ72_03758 [Emergomyces africanus]|uniref:Uncharacterized protein n=1 Tax=Emergomyces africanus TaxID=1955775 RepID=A0A1B7NYN1_9EURO|nr:hypothetical protein ACJ72_03758 [Emergomyces africanus]
MTKQLCGIPHNQSQWHLTGHMPVFMSICVPISGNTQPCASLSFPSQPGEMFIPPPGSKNPRHGVSSLCDLAHHTLNSHPTPARDVQDNISDMPTELP